MATLCFQSMWEFYFGRIFDSRYCLSSKHRCPSTSLLAIVLLLAIFIIRNWRFFASIESQNLTALNNLLKEMSKIIPWRRYSGDPVSVNCTVKVDSYQIMKWFQTKVVQCLSNMMKTQLSIDEQQKTIEGHIAYLRLIIIIFLSHEFYVLLLVRSNRFKTCDWATIGFRDTFIELLKKYHNLNSYISLISR